MGTINMEDVRQKGVINHFRKYVINHPSKIAVIDESDALTYQQLDSLSNNIAGNLARRGVRQGDIVGVMIERSCNLLAVMLAIFKLRAVYLPLDSSYPSERLAYMCQKSNCKTVLIEEKHEKHNEFSNETEILNLDVLLNPVDEKTDYCYDDNDLAYIIFTSGTTGEPKGVMIQHKGLANHLVAKVKDLSLNDQDTLAQTASQCFDISLWQFLSALMVGGTTSIISSETIRDIPCFYAALNRFAITVVQYVPSLLNQFIEGIRKIDHCASLSTIRVIATVGEPLQPWLCKKWFAIFPHIPILNHYGPTECADGVMHHLITSTPTSGYTPIGKPIEGLTAYVIEPASEGDLKQVADGEIGELYVSGVGVSCGYINDAEKTASAFLSNPFQQGEQVSRLYKTGDLVKIRSDGLFECLGRTDRQVKLRGYRIELNEVDNVISKFEKIKISATKLINENKIKITSRENLENKTEQDYLPRLVTFIEVLAPVTRKELVDFIREKLPDYMVPDAFYQLGKIPTNSNGKLDYNALPSPDNIRPVIDTEYSPPQSSQEKQLCSIFSRVLHLDKVGIKDKFIELGGDSLRAMLAINFINKEMSCGVQLFELYNLTIDELAKKIENGDNRVMLPEITQSSASPDGNYPLSQTQRHLWFLWKLEPEIKNYILQTSFELTGHIDSNNIRSAWGELIESYDTFSIRFLEEGGEPFIRFSTPNTTLDELDFSPYSEEVQAEKLKEIKLKNAEYEFDLEKGPIYKALLIKMSDARAMILFTTHEIIMDAWSLSLLAKKFSSFYHHLPVEKEKIAFKDYVSWEKNHINKNSLSEQKRFWEQSLSGELPKILLPSDKKRPAIRSYRCDSVGFSLSSDDRNNLHAVAKSANATLFSTILAIFDLLIYNYTEQTDVIIGAPHVIREKSGTENLIGFFLNMLPLRVKIDEENHFIDYLSQVNEKVSHSLSHANYPFSWMLESLNFSRDSNVSPIFQIMFNMYSEQAENISTSQKRQELLVRVKEINNHYSKYDLVLYCQEENDTLYFQFTYCVDLFSRGYIIRMAENFKELITNIIKNTTSPIGDYPCLSSSEINFLEEYNNIQKARSGELISLSNTLNEALEKYKHDTAYIWKDGSITYSELDCYINSICFYLESKGCHDGARILIQNDRGIHCIALILACCKMGITYVVAGSYNSQKRVVAIAESLNPIAIVTDRLATGFDKKYVIISTDEIAALSSERNVTPWRKAPENTTLQIVYTSGSSGVPKGVIIPVKACVNRLQWMWDTHPFQSNDRAIVQKSASLVASAWEIYGALLKGVPSYLLSEQELLDPERFVDVLVFKKITHLLCSPSVISLLLSFEDKALLARHSLRFVTSSAEPLSPSLAKDFYETFPDVPLFNFYGSTECCSNAATCLVDKETLTDTDIIPVGVPLTNVGIAIVNRKNKLVPRGVSGELVIAGRCLSDGYLLDSTLTQEKFVPNDIDVLKDFGSLMYKTGDIGRFREDDLLELIGRKDNQVKYRGFRVELEEIELVLKTHPQIKDAAAKLITHHDTVLLVAFLVTDMSPVSEDTLKQYMRNRLPTYSIPNKIVFRNELPRLSGGKLNRAGLVFEDDENLTHSISANNFTTTERIIADIWEKLLLTNNINKKSNFFDLGGNSMLSVRCVALAAAKGVNFTVSQIYNNPVLDTLAASIKEQCFKNEYVSSNENNRLKTLPMVRFFYHRVKLMEHFNISEMFIDTENVLDKSVLIQAINQLTQDYSLLRMVADQKDDDIQFYSLVSAEGLHIQQIGCFSSRVEADAALSYAAANEQYSFKFDRNVPLAKCILFEAKVNEHCYNTLFILTHHYIVDGYSFRLLLDEIERYYFLIMNGEKPVPVYRDIYYLNNWYDDLELYTTKYYQDILKYWREQPWDMLSSISGDCSVNRTEYYKSINNEEISTLKNLHAEEYSSLCHDVGIKYIKFNQEMSSVFFNIHLYEVNVDVIDVLLSLLTFSFGKIKDDKISLFIDNVDMCRIPFGKNDDLSTVLGQCIEFLPLPIVVDKTDSILNSSIKINALRKSISFKGLGLRSLTYLKNINPEVAIPGFTWPSVMINYRGSLDNGRYSNFIGLKKSNLWKGVSFGTIHTYKVWVNIDKIDGNLLIELLYDKTKYSRAEIDVISTIIKSDFMSFAENLTAQNA